MKTEREVLKQQVDDAFYQGFAVAVGSLARDHGQPSMARDIMHSNGITIQKLRAAKVQPFDMEPLSHE